MVESLKVEQSTSSERIAVIGYFMLSASNKQQVLSELKGESRRRFLQFINSTDKKVVKSIEALSFEQYCELKAQHNNGAVALEEVQRSGTQTFLEMLGIDSQTTDATRKLVNQLASET